MKNIKRLVLVAMLTASVVLVMGSCNNGSGGGFTMNEEQKKYYEGIIKEFEKWHEQNESSAEEVKYGLEVLNDMNAYVIGFKIVDTQAGKPVAKGTTATALRKRFVPKKA